MRYVLVGSRTGRRRAMSFSRKDYLEKLYQVVFGERGGIPPNTLWAEEIHRRSDGLRIEGRRGRNMFCLI